MILLLMPFDLASAVVDVATFLAGVVLCEIKVPLAPLAGAKGSAEGDIVSFRGSCDVEMEGINSKETRDNVEWIKGKR